MHGTLINLSVYPIENNVLSVVVCVNVKFAWTYPIKCSLLLDLVLIGIWLDLPILTD
jgi:hypothetical protein